MSKSQAAWPHMQLRDIADIGIGVTLGRELGAASSIELPYLRVANVQDGRIDTSDVKTVRILPSELPRYELQKGDILLTEGGDFDKLGRGAVWDGSIPECLHQNHIFRVRVRDGMVPEFFAAYMASAGGRAYFLSCAKQTTNLASINKTQLSYMLVPAPSFGEQWRIAEILDSLNRHIGAQLRLILKQEEFLSALSNDLMRESLAYPYERLGSIAESAVDGPFGSNLKSEHYVDVSGVRVVRLQNIGVGKFLDDDRAYVSRRHAASLDRHNVRSGDLLVASLGDERHPLARACLYPGSLPEGIVKADCFRIRLDPACALNSYVMRVLNSQIVKRAVAAVAQGVTRDRVNLNSLLSIKVPLPPLSFQHRVIQVLDDQGNAIRAAEYELAKLQALKQGLMDDLLTGRVRVTSVS